MKPFLLLFFLAISLFSAPPKKPKLILAITIDQFRYDYLTRFRSSYQAGLERLLTQGAVFTNAQYVHFPTVTAVGHSTFLSGAPPSVSGIIANEWFDREENQRVTSVSDRKAKLLGGAVSEAGNRQSTPAGTVAAPVAGRAKPAVAGVAAGIANSASEGVSRVSTGAGSSTDVLGASPRRMLAGTIGDELKMSNGGKSRVIGISLKDRAAILPAGHMADGAYWFDQKSGNFVSSDYYFRDLPDWVKNFNATRPADKYRGATWLNHKLPDDLKAMYGDSSNSPFESSPFGNEVLLLFTERALAAEQLGKDDVTDVLAVSFSSNDKIGHDYGIYSPEVREVTLQTDKILDRLFQAVDAQVGMDNVLVVLTADHGASPSAAESAANRMPGGRYPANTIRLAIESALARQYGAGDWVSGSWDGSIYLNLQSIASKRLDAAEVRRAAAAAALAVPHIARVYTRDQLLTGSFAMDDIARRVVNGFQAQRSPDISFIPEPYWMVTSSKATTHGTPYGYDSHVPVIFMGPWVRAGYYHGSVTVNDIAPTLATLLDVETPVGSIGRVLTEMLQ